MFVCFSDPPKTISPPRSAAPVSDSNSESQQSPAVYLDIQGLASNLIDAAHFILHLENQPAICFVSSALKTLPVKLTCFMFHNWVFPLCATANHRGGTLLKD